MNNLAASTGKWAALTALAYPGNGFSGGEGVWDDKASEFVPTSINDAFKLCEFLYYSNSVYRKGSERVVDYFLTKLKLSGGEDISRKKFQEVLDDEVKVMTNLRRMGLNFMCYGNAPVSPHFPFKRTIRCVTCSTTTVIGSLEGANKKLQLEMFQGKLFVQSMCKKCRSTARHRIVDQADLDPSKFRLINWDPKRIYLEGNEISGDVRYWYKIPEGERER
jgi:hypothetical protein